MIIDRKGLNPDTLIDPTLDRKGINPKTLNDPTLDRKGINPNNYNQSMGWIATGSTPTSSTELRTDIERSGPSASEDTTLDGGARDAVVSRPKTEPKNRIYTIYLCLN